MAITLRHCVAYAEKLLILVLWVIGPYSAMNRAKTIKKNVKSMKVQPPMNAFFKKSENSAKGNSENQSSLNAASCSIKQQQSLCLVNDQFVTEDEVTRAELLWAMNVSYKHFSDISCCDVVSMFQLIFTDSNIASRVSLRKTKVAYYITHGLAPYFHNELKDSISQCRYLAACFDESLP